MACHKVPTEYTQYNFSDGGFLLLLYKPEKLKFPPGIASAANSGQSTVNDI